MRVLIVRIGAMGDVLHALPAVTALRHARPDWHIGWAVDRRWAPLLEADGVRPAVDALHVVPTRDWSERPFSARTLSQIRKLRSELLVSRYELCVDMQGTIRSSVISRFAGTRDLAGYADPREAPAAWLYRRRIKRRGVHVVEQGCALLGAAAGLDLFPSPVILPADAMAEMWCDEVRAGLGPFCVLAPTAGWGAKMWPAERYGEVARALGEAGYRVIVNASGAHDKTAEAVVEASGGSAILLRSTVAQMIALLRSASLLIAGDTGPLHAAAALGRPVVGLFGPTDPARNGPFGTAARILRSSSSRTDHSRKRAADTGLLEIQPADVIHEALELLRDNDVNGRQSR